jgi:hypothetical protein
VVLDDVARDDAAADAYVPLDVALPDADVVADAGTPLLDASDAGMAPDVPVDACVNTFYVDADGDGFGVASMTMAACTAPMGYATAAGDCDDTNDAVSPTGTERCDMARLDEDCDGTPNEGCECYAGETRVCPGVSDVGACEPGTQRCGDDGRWISACEGTVGPMSERCDGMDNDCDMNVDGPSADGSCPTFPNGRPACLAGGVCGGTCSTGYADCGSGAGCETRLGTTLACTACGHTCGWGCIGSAYGCTDPVSVSVSHNLVFGQSTCAIRGDRRPVCWGDNGDGELGTGGRVDATRPVAVMGLPSGPILSMAAGDQSSCAIVASSAGATSGAVHCWGDNAYGQLGNGTTSDSLTPVTVSGISDAVEVVTGNGFACARLVGGQVRCWGSNYIGQLGQDDRMNRSTPVTVVDVSGAIDLDAYLNQVCVATGTRVWCWGGALTGRVATSTRASRVAVGAGHVCSIFEGFIPEHVGQVYCWGDNSMGALGDGSTTTPATGVVVSTFGYIAGAVAVDIDAGAGHTCVATRDGRVFCWGANNRGQLGDGTTSNRTVPTLVAVTGVTDVAAGGNTSCAVSTTGTGIASSRALRCWGANGDGELGDGSTTDRLRPVATLAP